MRQLFWKEWHEMRLLPLAAAVCMIVLVSCTEVYERMAGNAHSFQRDDDIFLILEMTWGLFALVAGAGLFAQEVGSGGLMFLSTLPISRGRIWRVKVAVGTLALLLSLLAIGMALILPLRILLPGAAPAMLWKVFHQSGDGLVSVLILLDVFAMSLAVSPFLDRPISAMIAAGLASALAYVALATALNIYLLHHLQQYVSHIDARHMLIPARHDFNCLLTVTAALPLPLLLAISYWTFTRGETLRSSKRFGVGALASGASLAVAIAAFCSGSWLHWW